jgi:hypothetical protein
MVHPKTQEAVFLPPPPQSKLFVALDPIPAPSTTQSDDALHSTNRQYHYQHKYHEVESPLLDNLVSTIRASTFARSILVVGSRRSPK